MRWLFLIMTAAGCGGSEDQAVDAEFEVTVTNVLEKCDIKDGTRTDMSLALGEIWIASITDPDPGHYCGCIDEDGSDCSAVVDRNTESYTYGLIQDGDAISVLLDGEQFAQGSIANCYLTYESPVWLDSPKGGDVQWKVEVDVALVDMNGACESSFTGKPEAYDFIGVEKITVVGSNNDKYPIGRTVWKVISGTRTSG